MNYEKRKEVLDRFRAAVQQRAGSISTPVNTTTAVRKKDTTAKRKRPTR